MGFPTRRAHHARAGRHTFEVLEPRRLLSVSADGQPLEPLDDFMITTIIEDVDGDVLRCGTPDELVDPINAPTELILIDGSVEQGTLIEVTSPVSPLVDRDQAVSAALATFKGDLPAGEYAATIDWGDGTGEHVAEIISSGDGTFSVLGEHRYAAAGRYYTSVHVAGSDGSSGWGGAVVVTSADALVMPSEVVVFGYTADSAPTDWAAGGQYLGTFYDLDHMGGDASGYVVTVNWGDGTTSTASVAKSWDGGYDVTASHAYATAGEYRVSYSVERDGASAMALGTAEIVEFVEADLPAEGEPLIITVVLESPTGFAQPDGEDVLYVTTIPDALSPRGNSTAEPELESTGPALADARPTVALARSARIDGAWIADLFAADLDNLTVGTFDHVVS